MSVKALNSVKGTGTTNYSKMSLILNANRQYDPTHTLTLRTAFVKEMQKRFNKVMYLAIRAIEKQDVFGLKSPVVNELPTKKAFDFPTNAEKIEAFMDWFNAQVKNGILEETTIPQLGEATQQAWTNKYINDSYKRGVLRATAEARGVKYPIPTIADAGGINVVMQSPGHIDTLGLLYSRTFTELKGITNWMDTAISRVFADGLADGDSPRVMANKLRKIMSGAGADLSLTDSLGRFISAKRRAEMLARTEVIRAHHRAMVQQYENWKVVGVHVQAEWITAGDKRVCPECQQREGHTYTLKEARNMIPLHPNCRCIALPTAYEETKK